jgi:hypothetical protein
MNVLRRGIPLIALAGALVVVALELSGFGVPAFARGTATGNYVVATATATIAPGTTDIGNHCDDCTTNITLPFSYTLYDLAPFSSVYVSSNGNLQFTSNSNLLTNACPLPSATLNTAIMPYWDDLRTDLINGSGTGVFTSISGVAPNRIFNIEWRATHFGDPVAASFTTNFEVRLYEGQKKFDVVYGIVNPGNPTAGGASATVGVQRDTGSYFTQFECNTANSLAQNQLVSFSLPPTAVTLASFAAAVAENRVVVRWRTISEAGILGFNVFRNGLKLNANLILANAAADGGASYAFVDRDARRGLSLYRLQRVNVDGTRAWAGVTSARR